ncbi:WD40-repeat-containing domain protein, partial [Syncephalis pseudoplumigaleata]
MASEERDNEARTLENHTSHITSRRPQKDLLIVGSEDRSVTCFQYPQLEFAKLLVRCNLPVKDIAVNHQGSLLAIATEDPTITIKHIDESREVAKLRGHTKPVHCVAFAPTTNDLLSVDASGQVRLWREENDTFTCIKQWPSLVHAGILANKGGSQSLCWAPDGRQFAAAGASGIMLVDPTSGQQTLRTHAYLDKLIYYYDIVDAVDEQPAKAPADLLADMSMLDDDHDWMETEQPDEKSTTASAAPKFPVPSPASTLAHAHGMRSNKGMKAWSMNALSSWINNRRYYDYNTIGHIIGVRQDDHVVIRVEFNDTGAFRGFHFTDYHHFTRGVL